MIRLKGLYIHIPFCMRKCAYCSFFSVDNYTDELLERFVDALLTEFEQRKDLIEPPYTLYIGGGTPTLLPDRLLFKIIERVISQVGLPVEFTVEANPKTINKSLLKMLYFAGVNRLSLGIQSFSDKILSVLGRLHNTSDAFLALEQAIDVFNNINVDLIFGVPGQTLKDVEEDIKNLLMFSTPHVSYYGLSIEEGTYMADLLKEGEISEVDHDMWAKMYDMIRLSLTSMGYLHYEISNYAKRGFGCLHNMIYWLRREYIGLGPSAVSFIDGKREQNTRSINSYIKMAKTGFKRQVENIDKNRDCIEKIMLCLRTARGLNLRKFPCKGIRSKMDRLIELGFLERKGEWVRIKEKYWNVSNAIIAEII